MLLKQNEHLDARAAHGSAASHSTDETHWWTYDGVYSERRDGAEYAAFFFFFFCQTGVERRRKSLGEENGKEAERVEARGGA